MSLNRLPDRAPGRPRPTLAMLAVAVLVASGVSVAATAAYFEVRSSSGAPSPGTIAVTDDLGRTVDVPVSPDRVAVLSPNIMDTVFRLGLRPDVVGVDCLSTSSGGLSGDYSPDQIQAWNLSSSMCIQVSPSFDVEQLIEADPALVLASTIISLSNIEELSTTYHIPVVVLAPATVSGILFDVQLVSEIFGGTARAPALIAALETELASASALDSSLAANGTTLPKVLLTYYAFPVGSTTPGYYTYGPGTFGQSLIELSGGASISANATVAYPELSGTQVLYDGPSVVIYGTGFGIDLATYQAGPDWGQISAVASGHVDSIDSNLVTEADPTMILDGLPSLIGELHPS
jgi:iron complex transport system substrate-binding protein